MPGSITESSELIQGLDSFGALVSFRSKKLVSPEKKPLAYFSLVHLNLFVKKKNVYILLTQVDRKDTPGIR